MIKSSASIASNRAIIALLLVGITLVVYLPVKDNDFVSIDDNLYVTHNPRVQRGLSWDNFIWTFKALGEAANWHPLTWLSHMADCHIYGLNTTGHHFMSLSFHLISVALLFLVLHALTGALWRSAFVALLFAVHPLNVESVAWVAERKNVLSTMFWLLTMWAYCKYAVKPSLRRYLPVLIFFILGLMAKPMLVTLPFVLLLLDYWPLNRFRLAANTLQDIQAEENQFKQSINFNQGEKFWHKRVVLTLVLEKVPLLVFSAISSFVTILAQSDGGALASREMMPYDIRVLNTFVSYAGYLSKMILPVNLAVFYPHQMTRPPMGEIVVAVAVLLTLTTFVLWKAKRHQYLLVGWLWYLGTLVPVIGLVQVGGQAMADRYTYVPLIGIFVMISWGAVEITSRPAWRKFCLPLLAVGTVLGLSVVTRYQIKHWFTSYSLFKHTIAVTKDNYLAHNNFGIAYSEIGQSDLALEQFLKAVEIKPKFGLAQYNAGAALTRKGQIEEAIPHYWEALQYPNSKDVLADTLNALGALRYKAGDNKEAVNLYQEALRVNPGCVDATLNMAILFEKEGRVDEAIASYNESIAYDPDSAVYFRLARVTREQGKLQEAVQLYQKALDLDPDFAAAQQEMDAALNQVSSSN